MKKLLFSLIATVFFGFIGSAQENLEPVYGDDVTVLSSESSTGIFIDLGRPSRRCRGFGICIRKPKPKIETELKGNSVNLPIIKTDKEMYILVELNSFFDEKKFDTNFYVDEDITSTEDKLVIIKNIYKLDKTIGKFGGYKVLIK